MLNREFSLFHFEFLYLLWIRCTLGRRNKYELAGPT